MDTKNTGGAAFPQHGWSRDPEANKFMQDKGGMTLRDYFAANAMASLMDANCRIYVGSPNPQFVAEAAYEMADAMIAERAK